MYVVFLAHGDDHRFKAAISSTASCACYYTSHNKMSSTTRRFHQYGEDQWRRDAVTAHLAEF